MKKVLSLVLVLTLVLCTSTVALVASAASDNTVISLTVDKQSVKVGETFTLKFSMPEVTGDIGMMNFDIYYDNKVVSVDYSTVKTSGYPDAISVEASQVDDHMNLMILDSKNYEAIIPEADATAAYVELTCTALKEGSTTFKFTETTEDDDGNPAFDIVLGDMATMHPVDTVRAVNATVKVGSDVPDVPDVPDPTVWQVTLVYADGTSEVIDVEDGKTIPAEKVAVNPSAEYVYSWDGDVTAPITSEKTFTIVRSTRTYNVSVNGTVKSLTYKAALVETADAEKDGKAFAYWTKDGQIVSYDRTYKLLVYADTTIEAVYADTVDAKASAFIDAPYYTMYNNNLKMVSSLQVVLPAGVSVKSFNIYRAVRTDGTALTAAELIAKNQVASTGGKTFNAQGRLDYSILTTTDSVKYTDIVFVAELSDGTSVTSNVVTVGAQLAK